MIDLTFLHPMVVHFPIALLIVGLIADITGVLLKKEFFTKAALYLLLIGTAGIIAAFFSGNLAGEGVIEAGSLKTALETHENAATITMWSMIVVSVIRLALIFTNRLKGILHWVAVLFFAVGVLTMVRTAHYGGQLVYKHAAGVQLEFGSLPSERSDEED